LVPLGVPVSDNNLSDAQSRLIADQVREELARRRISCKGLAGLAKISISTLKKALSGSRPLTLATTIRLEEALGSTCAPNSHGRSYTGSHPANSAIIRGRRYRRSRVPTSPCGHFGDRNAIYAYRIEISWNDQCSSLVFRESERMDPAFAKSGTVSVPNQSGHIYLVTNSDGQYRLLIVSRPTISGEMYGIITTLQIGRGSQLMPVSAPVALVPVNAAKDIQFGQIRAGERCYQRYRQYLKR
jgi:hypothetical protein